MRASVLPVEEGLAPWPGLGHTCARDIPPGQPWKGSCRVAQSYSVLADSDSLLFPYASVSRTRLPCVKKCTLATLCTGWAVQDFTLCTALLKLRILRTIRTCNSSNTLCCDVINMLYE